MATCTFSQRQAGSLTALACAKAYLRFFRGPTPSLADRYRLLRGRPLLITWCGLPTNVRGGGAGGECGCMPELGPGCPAGLAPPLPAVVYTRLPLRTMISSSEFNAWWKPGLKGTMPRAGPAPGCPPPAASSAPSAVSQPSGVTESRLGPCGTVFARPHVLAKWPKPPYLGHRRCFVHPVAMDAPLLSAFASTHSVIGAPNCKGAIASVAVLRPRVEVSLRMLHITPRPAWKVLRQVGDGVAVLLTDRIHRAALDRCCELACWR